MDVKQEISNAVDKFTDAIKSMAFGLARETIGKAFDSPEKETSEKPKKRKKTSPRMPSKDALRLQRTRDAKKAYAIRHKGVMNQTIADTKWLEAYEKKNPPKEKKG